MRVVLTQIVVVHHGVRTTEPGTLLGEVVPKLQERGVLLKHTGYIHLHLIAQWLTL